MPINSPLMFTSAPPLLPKFTAASVWINDWFFWSYSLRSLDLELIIPAVTVEFNLYGLLVPVIPYLQIEIQEHGG